MWILGLKGLNRVDTDNSVELWLHLSQNRSVVTRLSLNQLSLVHVPTDRGESWNFLFDWSKHEHCWSLLKCFPSFLTVTSTLPDPHIRSFLCNKVKSSSWSHTGTFGEASPETPLLFSRTVFTRISTAALGKFSHLKCGAYSKATFIWRLDVTKNCIKYVLIFSINEIAVIAWWVWKVVIFDHTKQKLSLEGGGFGLVPALRDDCRATVARFPYFDE